MKLKLYIFGLMISTFSTSAVLACGVSAPKYVNLAISTAEEKIFSYDEKTINDLGTPAVVSNCRDTAANRRHVMITFGPNVVDQSDGVSGSNFDKNFEDISTCSIKNNPLEKIQSFENKKKEFDTKWKYINECVEVTVVELGSRPLSYPKDQIGCTVTAISSKIAKFNGGFCFFKPAQDSELHVTVGVNEACKKRKGLELLNMNILDLEGEVNFFTSLNYKDELDLSAFGTYPVKLSTNPLPFLFKPSDDFGILRPTFPGDYPVNEIHLGKIAVSNVNDNEVEVKTPFIVNNICKKITKNNITSSVCDYSNPFVAEIKLSNSKGQEIATWYDGGIAPTQWQGVLNGEGENISKELFKSNQNYKIEVTFSDPNFEYNTFKKRMKSKISGINSTFGTLHGNGGITDIYDIKDIPPVEDMVTVNPIDDVNFESGVGDLTQSRKRLNSFFSTTMFPPMYEKACSPDTGVCESIGKPFVKFTAKFKIDDEYSISNLEVERDSKILGSYKKKISEQPFFICE